MSASQSKFSHLNRSGQTRMVDVGEKPRTRREAVAFGEVRLKREVLKQMAGNGVPKGDVLAASRIAGILAAKRVGEIIPLCHPLALEHVEVSFDVRDDRVVIRSRVRSRGKTGVEMEALTAVSVASLTIYDMCKSADRDMVIGPIYLAEKSGGRSGTYRRPGAPKIKHRWL